LAWLAKFFKTSESDMRINGKSVTKLSMPEEPVDLAKTWAGENGLSFLDSSQETHGGRYSVVAANPLRRLEGNLWLDRMLDQAVTKTCTVQNDLPFPSQAWIGTIDYDGSYSFGWYENLAVYDHAAQLWIFPVNLDGVSANHGDFSPPELQIAPTISEHDFCRMVQRAKEWIAAGDIYQVCLACPWKGVLQGSAWTLYHRWRQVSPAPFSAFLHQPHRHVLSSSPECYLQIRGRQIRTRPIKGTRPRHLDPSEDRRLAYELQTSAKEIAELVMITDLERNDLGKVCQYGSVHVSELLKLETFPHVFHLVSTIEGELREEVCSVDAVRACFPGGSITGAPKGRAMQIIGELEPEKRGLFTGALGYFGNNGDCGFNIAIRTLEVDLSGNALYWAGAGIVADSAPRAEWRETLHKTSGLLATLGLLSQDNAQILA
jgi:para-aminobenzoate synthetase component 1